MKAHFRKEKQSYSASILVGRLWCFLCLQIKKEKKKEGKSETVERMRKYEKTQNRERDTKQGERISFVVPVVLTF